MNNKDIKENIKELQNCCNIEDEDSYRPLPEGLTIDKSSIDGLGLFCTQDFNKTHVFGISHVAYTGPKKHFKQQLIRTPLGGFINHSEEPNCKVIRQDSKTYQLVASEDIKAGDELTVYYHTYGID